MVESSTLISTDIALLPSVALNERAHLPEVPAVYFALSVTGEVLYVGKANNLRGRWYGHHRFDQLRKFQSVRLAWLEQPEIDLEAIERLFIQHYDPPLNNSRNDERPVVARPHCSACQRLGSVPPFDLFFCMAHGGARLVMRGPKGDSVGWEHRLTFGSDHRIVIQLENIAELELEPYDETQGEHYEDFVEPA